MKKTIKIMVMVLLVFCMSIPVCAASNSYTISKSNSKAYRGSSSTYKTTATKTVFQYNDEGEPLYSVTGTIKYYYNYKMIGTSLYAQPISYKQTLTIYDEDNEYTVNEKLSKIYMMEQYGKNAYTTGYFKVISEGANINKLHMLKCTVNGKGRVTWQTSNFD